MKTRNLLFILLFSVIISFGVNSCQKEEITSPEILTAEDDAIADELYENIFTEIEVATSAMEDRLYGSGLKSFTSETCKIITIDKPSDTIFWPKTITVDYGDGCTGTNNRIRKGKIIIVVSSKVTSPNYSRTITLDSFYIDEYKIEGTKTIARQGLSTNQKPSFSISLVNGKITSPDGKTVTREFAHTREWITGFLTPRNRWDDEYMVTGTASGTDRNGTVYTREIIKSLHVKIMCPWIVSGSIKISKTGKPDVILDYGDDTCDRVATITIGDKTTTIQLHR